MPGRPSRAGGGACAKVWRQLSHDGNFRCRANASWPAGAHNAVEPARRCGIFGTQFLPINKCQHRMPGTLRMLPGRNPA